MTEASVEKDSSGLQTEVTPVEESLGSGLVQQLLAGNVGGLSSHVGEAGRSRRLSPGLSEDSACGAEVPQACPARSSSSLLGSTILLYFLKIFVSFFFPS